jgi:hypothetical protein
VDGDRAVDGPPDGWRQRDLDDLGALAADAQHPVAVFFAGVGDIRGTGSARKAGSGGWLEKAQDQESWFFGQLFVVFGIAVAHCFGWDRLDELFDEESGVGGRCAQR